MTESIRQYFCLHRKYLVYNLVLRNLKVKYRRSIFGFLWTLITPLAMTTVYYVVFSRILSLHLPSHLLFILSGVFAWGTFNQTLMEGSESIVLNMGLLTKVPVPLQVFPWVGALTNFTTLISALPILVGMALLEGISPLIALLYTPPILGCLILMAYALSLMLSMAYVLLRDLRHALGIGMQIWFYATPVLYPESMIPLPYRWILIANPLASAFSSLHCVWTQGLAPPWSWMAFTLAWTLALTLMALGALKKFSAGLLERL